LPRKSTRTQGERAKGLHEASAWREFHHPYFSTMSNSIADLATVDVPEPCATSAVSGGTQLTCSDRFHLVPDSLVVHVMGNGNPAPVAPAGPAG